MSEYGACGEIVAASTPRTIKPLPSDGPLRSFMDGLSRAGAGKRFFQDLVRELTMTLDVEYAFVAELVGEDPMRARTLAVWADGELAPDFEYEIGHTPCRELLFERYCCYPVGSRHCFPEDRLFSKWTIEGYAGARFVDDDDNILGWMAIMSRSALSDTALTRDAMCFISDRTSSELQRIRTEKLLMEAHEELEARMAVRMEELEEMNDRLREEVERRERIETELNESRQRYELSALGSNDGLWDWNLETGELYVSERWRKIMGWGAGSGPVTWEGWMRVIHPEDRESVEELVERHWRGERAAFEAEYRIDPERMDRWALCRGAVIRNGAGEVTRFAGSLTDITSRKRNEQRLVFEATHDHLTGLANRALFMDRIEHAIALNARDRVYDFAVLFIDLDRFKVVNDSLGHQSGDELLCEIARRVERAIRPVDLVARLGGDEFAVLVENVAGPRDATMVADRILQSFASSIRVAGEEIYPGASIGIALSSTGYRSAGEMIRDADTAMYRAKDQGRGRYQIFDSNMHLAAVKRLQVESDIRRAIDRNELSLAFQPIVSVASGGLDGFEALVRWNHPSRGLIMPADFIPIAEETGLISSIGAWVNRAACRQLQRWSRIHAAPLTLSVNLSVRELLDPDLVARTEALLCEHVFDGGGMRLEITESAMMENPDSAVVTLGQLRGLGLQLCVDDFGTGYSSLAYLTQIPIDSLKIDRSFVSNVDHDDQSEEMVRMIVGLAHHLDLKVIAEGVETMEQLQKLVALECDYVQGYLFGRPLPEVWASRLLFGQQVYAPMIESARRGDSRVS